jgi:aquaporin Z
VTWAFLQQGKISGRNALFYTLAQFAGGLAAPALLLAVLGDTFSHPDVRYAATLPGPQGQLVAFGAEFAITFVLMLTVLVCINSERWKPRLGVVVGVLVALYVTFESPLSGMSMNPARSFGSAATSGLWEGLWLYFTAPPLAALMAAVVYTGLRRSGLNRRRGRIAHSALPPLRLRGGPALPRPESLAVTCSLARTRLTR